MATMNVLDSAASVVAIEKPNANGQATMANSRPVAIASDQSPVAVNSPGFVSSASTTRPNDTTPYTALDVVDGASPANLTFSNVGAVAGGHIFITGASIRIDVAAVPAGMSSFRVHLFDAAPTAIADNAAFNLIAADRAKYLGFIEIGTPLDLGDTLFGRTDNMNFKTKLATASTTLYGQLQTVGAFTPAAETVKTITLHGIQS